MKIRISFTVTLTPLSLSNEKYLKSYCENLVRKINFKTDIINTIVNLDITLQNQKKINNDLIMFIDVDVIHPINLTRQHSSIASMKFSFSMKKINFFFFVFQRLLILMIHHVQQQLYVFVNNIEKKLNVQLK
jgi:hypothetical protein